MNVRYAVQKTGQCIHAFVRTIVHIPHWGVTLIAWRCVLLSPQYYYLEKMGALQVWQVWHMWPQLHCCLGCCLKVKPEVTECCFVVSRSIKEVGHCVRHRFTSLISNSNNINRILNLFEIWPVICPGDKGSMQVSGHESGIRCDEGLLMDG